MILFMNNGMLRSIVGVVFIAGAVAGCAGRATSTAADLTRSPEIVAGANVSCHDDVMVSSSGKTMGTFPHCEPVGPGDPLH